MTRLARNYPEEDSSISRSTPLCASCGFLSSESLPHRAPYPVPYPLLTEKNMPDAKKIGVSLTGAKPYTEFFFRTRSYRDSRRNGEWIPSFWPIYLGDPRLQKSLLFLNFHTGDNPAERSYIADCRSQFRQDISCPPRWAGFRG